MCKVVSEESRVVFEPYEVVNPYDIWVSDDSLVVQEIVAPEELTEEALISEIVGAIMSEEVQDWETIGLPPAQPLGELVRTVLVC